MCVGQSKRTIYKPFRIHVEQREDRKTRGREQEIKTEETES